jgi:hypothetical protein
MNDRSAVTQCVPHLIAGAMGAVVFFVCFGMQILTGEAPLFVTPSGDLAAEIAGYFHFVNDGFRFPLFVMPAVNQPEGSNLLFTGGVPLVALIAKVLRAIFGQSWNLLGVWYLACCVLQTHSMFVLMKEICGRRPYLLSVASVVAGLAFAFLTRTGHISLMGQFIVIYPMALLVSAATGSRSPGRIIILSALSIVVSMFLFVYFAIVNALVFAATVATLVQAGSLRITRAIAATAACFLIVVFFAWAGGYFWGVGRAEAMSVLEYGHYGLNLGALIAPPRSLLFPHLVFQNTWWEGTFYLGVGIVALLALVLYQGGREILSALRTFWIATTLLLILFLVSLGGKISFQSVTILAIEPPRVLQPVLGMARVAGRLFWPIGYLIIGFAIAGATKFYPRAAPAMVLVAVALSVMESTFGVEHVRREVAQPHKMPLDNKWLAEVLERPKRVSVYPTYWCVTEFVHVRQESYRQIDFVSALLNKESNLSVTARKLKDCNAERNRGPEFSDETVTFLMTNQDAVDYFSDGRRCAALNLVWTTGMVCSRDLPSPSRGLLDQLVAKPALGTNIDFGASDDGQRFLADGWAVGEREFTWTIGQLSTLHFTRPSSGSEGMLQLTVRPLLYGSLTERRFVFRVNGVNVLSTTLSDRDTFQTVQLPLPANPGRLVKVTIENVDLRSPKDLGLNADTRQLGLAVKSAVISFQQPR